ncbi:cwf21 domain protein [Cryptosporidium meleagridis]|uniref:Cwf21 domain protein n=1 Tax=Cryptosporidium meleagridis TaxID=93969 RepID=A0A2P4Z2A9_9CRYT|nr:cwf21 domain protein [Cryptosporidium meleagridis]
MYNGVGLRTVRGSGTSGHVQKNLSAYIPKQWERKDNKDGINLKSEPRIPRKARHDPGLIEHEKLRKMELEILQFTEEQESKGLKGADLEEALDRKREELASSLRKNSNFNRNHEENHSSFDSRKKIGFVSSQFGDDVDKLDSNQLSRLKEEELKIFRSALGLDKPTRGRHKQRYNDRRNRNGTTFRNEINNEDWENEQEGERNERREGDSSKRSDIFTQEVGNRENLGQRNFENLKRDFGNYNKYNQHNIDEFEDASKDRLRRKLGLQSQINLRSYFESPPKSRSRSHSHSHSCSHSYSNSNFSPHSYSNSRSYSNSPSNSKSKSNLHSRSGSNSYSKFRNSYFNNYKQKSSKKKIKREAYSSSARNLAELDSLERKKKHRYRKPRRSRSPSAVSRYRSFSRSLSPQQLAPAG